MEEGNRQQVERAGGLQARCWVEQSDTELLRHCSVDLYKASGPGGQKRNKTSSAVRLRHNWSVRRVVRNMKTRLGLYAACAMRWL